MLPERNFDATFGWQTAPKENHREHQTHSDSDHQRQPRRRSRLWGFFVTTVSIYPESSCRGFSLAARTRTHPRWHDQSSPSD